MEDTIDDYVRSLETQLENKVVFLKQSRDSLKKLRQEYKDEEAQDINPDIWKAFMKKPVMYVEKSDPIGLSLADVDVYLRNESSLDWIEMMTGKEMNYCTTLKESINNQRNMNKDLSTLIGLLEQDDLETEEVEEIPVASNLLDQNQKLWDSLQLFTKEVLCKNENNRIEIYNLLKRLVKFDPLLTVSDFRISHESERLYRLLSKANLVDVIHIDNNTNSQVRLINFNDNDLS
ncbi:similar to Saccharomyces cerevisiae YJR135C MCM22 Protein involved in minichromosome maintenance [Maudiozyma barnettii]|uniref:Similar to Saccharomyces cerevisiae YJR135C MCM22 Protein involved in minichromosome maintenance n=1 Tax=Maudiozyma barnettii TaxID=61262 RepID=A0A8H2VJM5_9SACH|nr:Mcm22p [Kazachstania barnettii]CAB4256499.1 similar to Saccharomyces cerevisiae YJR135C MCM22 Protein involved in minichromosome maintenance [Kazachstania barnettii]CAD1785102.1 similar to Saccharomyces cerevisiae YJR135C MCM22 Protein involved in minichromosome maintenance [Kazachstania barnettii]